ncbi:MAG: Ig-like domain-containing protein [Coriobacteriia bacterium]|nr:Ig-like domain-containing protein [Coriobacteriia bacterium]
MRSIKKTIMLGVFAMATVLCLAPGLAFAATIGQSDFDSNGGEYSITAKEGGTYDLSQDVTGHIVVETQGNVTINLNGHTLTNDDSSHYAIYTKNVDKFCINGASANGNRGGIIQASESSDGHSALRIDSRLLVVQTGSIENVRIESQNTECIQMLKNQFTFENVELETKGAANSLIYCALGESNIPKITVNSGTFTAASSTKRMFEIKNGVEVTLQGGTYNRVPGDEAKDKDGSVDDSLTGAKLGEGLAVYKPEGADALYTIKEESSIPTSGTGVKDKAGAKVKFEDSRVVYFYDRAEAKTYADESGGKLVTYAGISIQKTDGLVYDGKAKIIKVSCGYIKAADVVEKYYYGDSYETEVSEDEVKNAGKYKLEISVVDEKKDDYILTGETSREFEIAKASTDIQVTSPEKMTVGESCDLEATAFEGATFTYDSDKPEVATVTADGRVKALSVGTASITVSSPGDSNHEPGTTVVTIAVKAKSLAAEVELSQTSFTYDDTAHNPSVKSVVLDDKTLTEGKDYTVSYGENINAGKDAGIVKIAGTGSFKGSQVVTFEIKKASTAIDVAGLSDMTIGDEFRLNPSAFDGAKFTYESSDPKVASVSKDGTVKALAAGTATITVSTPGDSNHESATKDLQLTVKAAPTPAATDISAAKVTLSKTSFTYNGKAQKPSVKSVVLNGKTLKAGTDYTASIASGKKVGTYSVTVTAKGSYTGKATASFTVNPKGVTKFKVSKAKKAFKAKWAKSKVERSGVQVKYSTKKSMANAKTVKAKGAAAKAKTVKKLKKKTKYYVQARTYKVVNGKTYYSAWSAKKAVKTK